MSMHWNHRIVRVPEGDEHILLLCEVFYDNGKPVGRNEGARVFGEDINEMWAVMELMRQALCRPILDDFEQQFIDQNEVVRVGEHNGGPYDMRHQELAQDAASIAEKCAKICEAQRAAVIADRAQRQAVPQGETVSVPRKLAERIIGLLAQECAPCADPACRITDNPEKAITECREQLWAALSASPTPPASAKRDYCHEKLKPGGCQLHNLHCGFPKCNEPPIPGVQAHDTDGRKEDQRG